MLMLLCASETIEPFVFQIIFSEKSFRKDDTFIYALPTDICVRFLEWRLQDPNSILRDENDNMFTKLTEIGWDEGQFPRKCYLDAALITCASYTEYRREFVSGQHSRPAINALAVASAVGDLGTVATLCSNGVSINKSSHTFGSPLCAATRYSSIGTINHLFEKGATIERDDGISYFDHKPFLQSRPWAAAAQRGDQDIFKLIKSRVPRWTQPHYDVTLEIVYKAGNFSIVADCLGACEHTTAELQKLLVLASNAGQVEVIRLLADRGQLILGLEN
jgi:hypothetical protein